MTERDKISERSVDVARSHNAVVVTARDHTWVEIVDESGRRARDEAGGREAVFAVESGRCLVRSDGRIERAVARAVDRPQADIVPSGQPAALRLTAAEGTKLHPVDGIPVIPADGDSSCVLVIEKLSVDGARLTRRSDTEEVFLRATGGTLQDERGRRIRSTRLSGGEARLRLVSQADPKVVTVEAFGNPPLAGATLRVEFA